METCLARFKSGLKLLLAFLLRLKLLFTFLLRLEVDGEVAEGTKSSCNCCFTRLAKEAVILPCFGNLRHLGANKKSLFQASIELELTTSLNTVVSLVETCCLADFRMRLKTLFFGIDANDGDTDSGDADNEDTVNEAGASGGAVEDTNDGATDNGDVDNEDAIAEAGANGGAVRDAPWHTDDLGGFPDPGHLSVKGPLALSWPEAVVHRDLRQKEYVARPINSPGKNR